MNPPLDSLTGGGSRPANAVDTRHLDAMQFTADPLADDTVARIVGTWTLGETASGDLIAANASRWQRIAAANRALATWSHNGQLESWKPADGSMDPEVAAALRDYLRAGAALPEWADRAKIERAEQLFFDYGPLSCILLFCASLPECYVIPDLADVLHAAGQLEQHTDYRVRTTAAMIFPVMMHGGLTTSEGGGIAQILKVRLIHATIRNLILRGRPEDAADVIAPIGMGATAGQGGQVHSSQGHGAKQGSMHQVLFAHGWNVREQGLPCNQEELAYTLLTFNYVFLRSLRQLGLGLSAADEQAYLHCWNVAAHVLGVRRELMAETMEDAEALFTVMQARGRQNPPSPDVRPGLGQALMNAMASSIKLPILRHFPELMTFRLCGEAAREVGVTGQAPWSARLFFGLVMGLSAPVDALMRLWWPEFALSRLVTRVLGYHVMASVLLDQTRPLKLPDHLLNRIDETMTTWSDDPRSPGWINAIEDALTTSGSWRQSRASASR